MNETTDTIDTEDDDAVRAFLRGEGVTEEDIESIIESGPISRALLNVDRYQPVAVLRESTRRFKREFPETYPPDRACEVPMCGGTPATRFAVVITTIAHGASTTMFKYACRKHTDGVRGAVRKSTEVMPQLIAGVRWTWSEEPVS